MSEFVLENTVPQETVIVIEGGPELTTTVSQEVQTVIGVPAEPVVIDLNSGARGEPGSAVLNGGANPSAAIGSVGDIYIVTDGSIQSGNVYTKVAGQGWVYQGNIRGPAGGIDSVNGYTGPDVELTKGDLGLGFVDNTADTAKPVSGPQQTALNLKANDNAVVHLSGTETIPGTKIFTGMPEHITQSGELKNNHLIAQGVLMFHDRFRFTTPTITQSNDGTTFTAGPTGALNALDGRSDGGVTFADTNRYLRWYWNNTSDIQYGNLTRLITRWGYVAGATTSAIVTAESSADGTNWTVRGTSTVASPNTKQHIMYLNDNGGDNHFRVTIQVVGNSGSSIASLLSLEVQAYRFGSQGKGPENEVPYWWNSSREIRLYDRLGVMSHNTIDLGTTTNRFKDGYFQGNLYGNGSTLSNVVATSGDQTIAGNKTLTGVIAIGNTNNLRIGTSLPTISSYVLIGDASGYVRWGNPTMANHKPATDNASTYLGGVYAMDSNGGTYPENFGTILQAGTSSDRSFQIVGGKSDFNRLRFRIGDSAQTNGWSPWAILANDGQVVHNTGNETIAGTKTFSSAVIVPTPTASNHAATKGYIDSIVDAAPGTLDTLNELAAALGDDPNFATTITNQIATKEPIINTGAAGLFYRSDKTWAAPTPAQVGLSNVTNDQQVTTQTTQTITGTKTFTPDTYFTGRVRATANTSHETQADWALGQVAGDVQITRQHNHVGGTNVWKIVDLMHRRAAGNDWSFAQMYTGVGVDTSFLASPTTGTSGTALKTWIRRDPQNGVIALGSGIAEYLTLSASAATVGTGVIFTGNGSGLTTLNGTNISSGTVADARLSTNVALLAGTQTLSGAKTFSSLITASAGVTVTGTVTATLFSGSGASLTALSASNLSTGTVPQARVSPNITRVDHGATAGTARPTTSTYVEWVGSVLPTNMAQGDTWINTATNGNTADNQPSGAVMASASSKSVAANGWYWMEGQEILISGDTPLYNELTNNGTVFPYGANTNGSGAAGSTHFRLPNGVGRTIHHASTATTRRANNPNGTSSPFASLGQTGGGVDAILTTLQMPLHSHGISDPGHAHALYNRSWGWAAVAEGAVDVFIDADAYTTTVPVGNRLTSGPQHGATKTSGTGISINNNGSSHPHDVLQPFITLRWMIKR